MTAQEAASDPSLAAASALATARALAPPPAAFRLLAPLLAPEGVAAVFMGDNADVPPETEVWADGIAILTMPE